MIKDLDIVALTRDLPEYGLASGDTGTVVHVYADGKSYEVEFATFGGRTIAVATLPVDAVRAIESGEIPHTRTVADAAQ